MKNTSKILALVLVVMTLLMSLSAITASAEEANEATVTKVFEATELGAKAQGDYADGQEVTAGTDGYFTLIMSAKVKVDSSSKTFDDGYSSNLRVNWGGKSTTSLNVIVFEVPSAATVKVWWVSGGDGRSVALWDNAGNTIAGSTASDSVKNALYINEFAAPVAGTYMIAQPEGSNYTFKVEVSWKVTLEDPNACEHEWTEATCLAPKTCSNCGSTEGEALGHEAGEEATCTTAQICTRCEAELSPALGHTLTFTNTLPTAEAAGKTTASCSVCEETYDFGEVNVMTGGTYVLDAADLADVAQYSMFDGQTKVVGGVFACHLSNKYYTQSGRTETFKLMDNWTATHRMNLQGTSEFLDNGGLKNFVQIVTTETTTIKIAWQLGDVGRQMAIYTLDGQPIEITESEGEKNGLDVAEFTVPAGAYLIGTYMPEGVKAGGNYIFKIVVDVEIPHVHEFANATCTEPSKCECGETQVDALGHSFAFGECTRCGEADPDYVEPPVDGGEDGGEAPAELGFFEKIIAWIMELINQILAMFKK